MANSDNGTSRLVDGKDLIAEGFVGRVLSATMIGCAPNWGPSIDRAYQADFANGANLLTITGELRRAFESERIRLNMRSTRHGVFVHVSALERSGISILDEGQAVIVDGQKGLEAARVRLV